MQTTDIPKRQMHSYTWKPKNISFNSTIGLMNWLIENNLVVVTERQYPKCQYCGIEVRGTEAMLIGHIYTKHRDKIQLK